MRAALALLKIRHHRELSLRVEIGGAVRVHVCTRCFLHKKDPLTAMVQTS